MIEAVTSSLVKKMELSDMGKVLDENGHLVYSTVLEVRLSVRNYTPVMDCEGSDSHIEYRRKSDYEKVKMLAAELLGLDP